MDILIKAAQLILALSILVVVHEWGHFIAARIFKTKVEKFYLFFDPWFALFKFKRGDTEYGVGWLPLGGYVKIAGMIDESMDKEQLKEPPQPWEFRSKPAWQRLIIMLGGIIMNVILGIFIYAMILFGWGEEYIPNANLKHGIAIDSTAMKLGFRDGDKLVSVDGKPIKKYNEVFGGIVFDDASKVVVDRAGKDVELNFDRKSIKKIIDARSPEFIAPRVPFVVDSLEPNSPATKTILTKGDRITGMDGKNLYYYHDIVRYLASHKGKDVEIKLQRGAETLVTKAKVTEEGKLGVYAVLPTKLLGSTKTTYQLGAAFPAGVNKAVTTLRNYVKQFKLIFSSEVQGYKHIGGFISMGKVMSASWDWPAFWSFAAFLSIALAFMNLLPIPALDGGHVIFTLYEIVARRKPNEKFLEYAQVAGMIILIGLMLFANGNDILREIFK